MKKYLNQGFLATFIIASVFSFGAFSKTTPAEAQSQTMTMCQTVESIITAGLISSDKANSARTAAGCPIPVPTICPTIEMFINVGIIAPDKADAARNALGCTGSTPVPPTTHSLTVLSPNSGENYKLGDTMKIKWTYSPLPPKDFSIYLVSADNSAKWKIKTCGDSSTYYQGEPSDPTNYNLFYYNWPVGSNMMENLASGKYKVQVGDCLSPVTTGSSNYFTISSSASTDPIVSVTGTPTLQLFYDSAQKESQLRATFNISVQAGNQDLDVYQRGNPMYFANQTDSFQLGHDLYGATTLSPVEKILTYSDPNSQTYYVIPAGTTESFTASSVVNPKIMFAGSYVARFSSIVVFNGSTSNAHAISTPVTQTNAKTIIGETSPYITSVNASSANNGILVVIKGVRLTNSSNVNVFNYSGKLWGITNSTDGTSMSFMMDSYPGNYSVQVTDSVTGASNLAGFKVSTSNSLVARSMSLSGVQSYYSPGQIIKYSVKGVASDSNPGNPDRGFNVQWRLDDTDSGNAVYNPNTSLWDVTLTAPSDVTRTHTIDSSFYCSRVNLVAGCSEGQVEKAFTFDLTSSQPTNQPPVINGVTAPTALSVGEAGTWTVQASDPENGPLSYSVDWGDRAINPTSPMGVIVNVQTSTFTHSYSAAGNYTVSFAVKDNVGQVAKTSTTVVVRSVPQAGAITVTSPNGGEGWMKGTTQTIRWQDSSLVPTCGINSNSATCINPAPSSYDIKLFPYRTPCTGGSICPSYVSMPYSIANAVGGYSFDWTVGNVKGLYDSLIPSGSYTVEICKAGSDNCDSSDSYFKVYNQSIQLPSLSINPGVVTSGQQVTLNYSIPAGAVSMNLLLNCPAGVSMSYGGGGNDNCNTGINWTAPFPTASMMTAVNNTQMSQTVSVSLSAKYPDGSTGGALGQIQIQPQPIQPPVVATTSSSTTTTATLSDAQNYAAAASGWGALFNLVQALR